MLVLFRDVLMVSLFILGLAPNVQVYSRNPGKYGEKNVLICHASDFHPPEIKIELLKNGIEIPDAKQTDLAFEDNWHYHLTKHVPFTPMSGETYLCRVTHVGIPRDYVWGIALNLIHMIAKVVKSAEIKNFLKAFP